MAKKFYQQSRLERLTFLLESGILSKEQFELFLNNTALDETVANSLIENQLTQFPLPMGVALNFVIDGKEKIIPMVVEEPSVIAACSNAAKVMKKNGFSTTVKQREMIGQIILKDVPKVVEAKEKIEHNLETLFEIANQAHPSIVSRGGGLKRVNVEIMSDPSLSDQTFLTIYLMIDVKNAMGANIINTILEGVTPYLLELTDGASLMSILSNYNTEALVSATCSVSFEKLGMPNIEGETIAKKIAEASLYAKIDPYRAATHNKGIMNGIDSVVIATGNDPRAVEAGANAYASRNGRYEGMSLWWVEDQCLKGELTLPMAVGVVGGAISVLPMAKANLELLDVNNSEELARVVLCVGLAQNFAALKALVTDGIQKGHMNLHASSLAIQVGAQGEEITLLTQELRKESKMNTEVANTLLKKIRKA